MNEKIKISLSKSTLDMLKKDCEDFRFMKNDGTPNMNAFINTLIANYYETFTANEEHIHDEIQNAISILPDFYKDKVMPSIVNLFAKQSYPISDKHNSTTFAFKPTKISDKAITYIETMLSTNESISSFYRRMFISYTQMTKNEREKLLYKENYELLQKAIKKGVQVCIALQSNEVLKNASVFSVSPAKDELFNYVLVYGEKNITLRLSSVRSVSLLSLKSYIPEKNSELFARQVACAAQYPMYSTDDEPIKVQLTEKGKKLFGKIYLYRPTPISIDGDIYTFNCSANQLLYYFERFGDSALILSPKRLGIFMRNYYHFAVKKYRSIYKTD
ncbi:MAG: hypothetical protein K2M48_04140 [Clostridiales bacterium]|nr:hypothetical protein [Clostridiales bacterium]